MVRILIIDYEVSTRRPLRILLERAGPEVRSAAIGSEALRLGRAGAA
jgi:CheY-like chemotaxis protein